MLTTEQIEALTPGVEIDNAVGEALGFSPGLLVPSYSLTPEAAVGLLEELERRRWSFTIDYDKEDYEVVIFTPTLSWDCSAETLPGALCKAFLLAHHYEAGKRRA